MAPDKKGSQRFQSPKFVKKKEHVAQLRPVNLATFPPTHFSLNSIFQKKKVFVNT